MDDEPTAPTYSPDHVQPRTYPPGVTSWVDVDALDVEATSAFYGALLGWDFADAGPPGAPSRYVVATLGGHDAAAVASMPPGSTAPPAWHTYVAVDDCDAAYARLVALGAVGVDDPADAGEGGRTATLTDPQGAEVRLWQARRRLGAQVANLPGAWNFSDLHTDDPQAATAFYRDAFGWDVTDQGWSTSIRVPGYGDHLAATVDPGIRERQALAPEGFADVIGAVRATAEGEQPHWHVTFTVADRDASAALAERLGGVVVRRAEDDWTRSAVVRDPAGARFTVSQFAPREWAEDVGAAAS